METAYKQIKLRVYDKKAKLGAKLAELAEKADDQKRGQGKTLKVAALSQGNCQYVPSIRVAGKWLRRFGFELGDEVTLTATQGQILIIRKEGK
jgi:hypothetical protein